MAERIQLEGLLNTRDLGGYEAADNRRIRPRTLIRSGALADMTPEDKRVLFQDYGVRTVIDLRTGLEAGEKPDPGIEGVSHEFNPILDEETAGFTHENEDGGQMNMLEGFLKHAKSLNGRPEKYIGQLYKNLVLSDGAMARYGHFLNLVLEAAPGAVLWHCSAGKDRAGMATAFLLTALGVDRETVLTDFTLSNQYLRPETERMMRLVKAGTADEGLERTAEVLCQVKREYLEDAFRLIEETYGSLENYMTGQLGMDEDKLKRLRDRYLI